MSQNEKKVFGRHKKQEESPLEQTAGGACGTG